MLLVVLVCVGVGVGVVVVVVVVFVLGAREAASRLWRGGGPVNSSALRELLTGTRRRLRPVPEEPRAQRLEAIGRRRFAPRYLYKRALEEL